MRQNLIDELACVMTPPSASMKAPVRSLRPEKSEATTRGVCGSFARVLIGLTGSSNCAVCGWHLPASDLPGSPA